MESTPYRLRENVPGPFYVDSSCIYCDLCVDMYPHIFKMLGNHEWAVVHHQPTDEKEYAEAVDGIEACPTGSIRQEGVF